MEAFIFFGLLILFILLIVGMIFGISYLASSSRRKKQNELLRQLPSNVDFHAIVRYNRGKKQDEILKVKAFEASGIIYVIGSTLYFKSTLGFETQFDLKSSIIRWEGENLINGLLKWFSIRNDVEQYYFNVETGMFIFHLDKSKPTTLSIYNRLVEIQKQAVA